MSTLKLVKVAEGGTPAANIESRNLREIMRQQPGVCP